MYDEAVAQLTLRLQRLFGALEREGIASAGGTPCEAVAARLVFQLTGSDSDEAEQAAYNLLDVVSPAAGVVPLEFWGSPLGRLVFLADESIDDHPVVGTISTATAVALLGMSRTRVHELVSRGDIRCEARGRLNALDVRGELLKRLPAENRSSC